jgi:RNA polymerase sigma factor for flagellar operon FliA
MNFSRREKEDQSREEFILSYHGFVCKIANKLKSRLPDSVPRADLIAVGMIGLIEAYDRFDASKGVPFSSYAELRTRGAMIDMLRQQDWVPRSIRRRTRELNECSGWFQKKHERRVSKSELAELLQITEKQLEKRISRDQISVLISTEQQVYGSDGISVGEQLASKEPLVEEQIFLEEREIALRSGIDSLPPKERLTIELYYSQGLSLRSIGEELGVTESRACQIRGKAIQKLQKKLQMFCAFC